MGNRSFDRSARDRGLRSVSFLTRITVAASVGLTAAFSAVAAIAFSGNSTGTGTGTGTGNTPTTAAPAGGQLVALPPRNGGSLTFPQPPVGPPVGAGGGGQTTSGGS